MKTPREILLQKHQAVEPKLDAVRHRALAALERPDFAASCMQFVHSLRWHLAGMSAVWLLVLLLHVGAGADSPTVMARVKMPSTRVLVAALVEHQRTLIDLTDAPTVVALPSLPPRRSEIRAAVETV